MKSLSRRKRNPSGSITIREVAAAAGVSTATVSYVLAGLEGVRDQTRERVLAAVAKLNFQPNRMAQGLRLRHRKVVGVVIPDLQNPFFTGVVHGVESVLYEAGYTLLLSHSDGLAERERVQLEIMKAEGLAGLVLIPGNGPGASYEAIRTWEIPAVAVDRAPQGLEIDLVCSDNREGMRLVMSHLLSIGHKDIGLLNGPLGMDVTQERLWGYQDALTSAGIVIRDSFIIHGDFHQEGGRAAMAKFLEMAKPPRAVVIANNLMTLGALQAIHERGVVIPDELAVACFDDMPWAISLHPPLTAVAQLPEEIGRTAAQLLLARVADPQRCVRRVVLPTRLMVRSSCGAHPPNQTLQTGAAYPRTPAGVEIKPAADKV